MGKTIKRSPFLVVSITVLTLFILSQIFSNESRIKILNAFRTPLKVISGSYYVLRDIPNFKELKNENKLLRERINNFDKKLLSLQEAHLENIRLRKLLGFRESKKHKFIPSMVIAKDPLGLGNTIIIDKGKKDNVDKDMVVISGNGLVGRVRESGWSIARILLITDRDSVVGGILHRTRDEGAIRGTASGITMKYLELNSTVKEGDSVVTSGFSGVFEKGILIGKVVSVEKDASGLYLRATLKPEVDMMRLEEVLVIRRKKW
ncbi:rod shape-determining protein MreC [Candidatus Omnitrophota bacterium]